MTDRFDVPREPRICKRTRRAIDRLRDAFDATGGVGPAVNFLEVANDAIRIIQAPLAGGSAVLVPAPFWLKFSLTYADWAVAATSNDFTGYTLPAGAMVHACVIKHTTQFGGGGIINYGISVGIATDLDYFNNGVHPVHTAPNDTDADVETEIPRLPDWGSTTAVKFAASCVGANLDQATQGAVEIRLLASQVK